MRLYNYGCSQRWDDGRACGSGYRARVGVRVKAACLVWRRAGAAIWARSSYRAEGGDWAGRLGVGKRDGDEGSGLGIDLHGIYPPLHIYMIMTLAMDIILKIRRYLTYRFYR